MAPLPHNNTALYYIDYANGTLQHTAEVRFNGAVSPSAFGTTMNQFFNTISPLLTTITINTIRFQAEGTNVSNPVTTGIEGNSYGTGTPNDLQTVSSINFVGRSPGGRRVRLELFGTNSAYSQGRVTETESSDVLDAVAQLNGSASTFLAIDGQNPVWYPYVNVSVNAYWQRKQRAG